MLVADTVTAGTVAVDTAVAGTVTAGTVTADTVAVGIAVADTAPADTVAADTAVVGTALAGTVTADTVPVGTALAGTVVAGTAAVSAQVRRTSHKRSHPVEFHHNISYISFHVLLKNMLTTIFYRLRKYSSIYFYICFHSVMFFRYHFGR